MCVPEERELKGTLRLFTCPDRAAKADREELTQVRSPAAEIRIIQACLYFASTSTTITLAAGYPISGLSGHACASKTCRIVEIVEIVEMQNEANARRDPQPRRQPQHSQSIAQVIINLPYQMC